MAGVRDKTKQIEALRKLGLSEEEIQEVMEYDSKIDKGTKNLEHDLSAEQEKIAKKAAHVKGKAVALPDEKPQKKERKAKENPTKELVIAEIARFLTENAEISAENVEILNKTRQIAFKIGENNYEIALTEKRKPKK